MAEGLSQATSMGQCLASAAAHAGETIAYRYLANGETETDCASFAELHRAACGLAGTALASARPGDRCILLCEAGIDFAIGLYACFLAGIVAVPVPTPHVNRIAAKGAHLLDVVRDCRPRLVLASPDYWRRRGDFQALGWEFAALDFVAITRDHLPIGDPLPEVASQDLALLQYTSGSTSQPKGVMLSHGNLLANQQAIAGIADPDSRQTYCTWLPAYHDMGLAFYLQPVVQRATTIILPAGHFLQRPVRWLHAIDHYGCTFSACPNFALERLADSLESGDGAAVDLGSLQVVVVGAEPISAQTVRRVLPLLTERGMGEEALCPCYGLAESVTLASLTPAGRKVTIDHIRVDGADSDGEGNRLFAVPADSRVGNGQAPAGHGLLIVDPARKQRAPEGAIGEIWLKGPSIGQGYWGRPDESSATFAASLADDPGTWLRTGDLGLIRAGELFILGRSKDVVIIRGRNLYPADLEQAAQAVHPGIFAVAAFAISGADQSEGLALAVEVRRGQAGEGERIEAAVRAELASRFDAEVQWLGLFHQSALPRTTSGKMKRIAIGELVAAGEAPVLNPAKAAVQPAREPV